MGIRCFLAVELPTAVQQLMADAIAQLDVSLPRHAVRWVRPESAHLTVHFLGNNVAVETLNVLEPSFRKLCAGIQPFQLQTTHVDTLPPTGVTRVIYLGCSDATPLLRLNRETGMLVSRLEASNDTHAWTAHLTLGRVKITATLHLPDLTLPTERFDVSSVTLFKSILTPHGPRYEALGKFPFAGCNAAGHRRSGA